MGTRHNTTERRADYRLALIPRRDTQGAYKGFKNWIEKDIRRLVKAAGGLVVALEMHSNHVYMHVVLPTGTNIQAFVLWLKRQSAYMLQQRLDHAGFDRRIAGFWSEGHYIDQKDGNRRALVDFVYNELLDAQQRADIEAYSRKETAT